MESQGPRRRIWHEVSPCPHCKQTHLFPVLVDVRAAPGAEGARPQDAAPVFGGAPAARALAFACPTTQGIVSVKIADPPDGEIIGPDDPDRPPPESAGAPAPSPLELDYAEWVKSSRATAVDFCKTMLTAATGAVPVYFAVLKYLGAEAVSGSWFSRIGSVPPLLFLASAVIFALALRPRLALVAPAGFAAFRAARARQLNRDMLAGLAVFAAAILLAIGLGAEALGR